MKVRIQKVPDDAIQSKNICDTSLYLELNYLKPSISRYKLIMVT